MRCCQSHVNRGIEGLFDGYTYDPTVTPELNSIYYTGSDMNGGYVSGNVGGGGTNFWDVFSQGLKSASNILGTRYSVPQLNPGQLIQTGPYGTTMSQSNNGIPGTASVLGSGGISPILLIGGVGLIAVMMMGRH